VRNRAADQERLKRPRIPDTLWGVWAVNLNGHAVWLSFFATRASARKHQRRCEYVYRREPVRYVTRKFVAGVRVA
jgi:hypothetical protein